MNDIKRMVSQFIGFIGISGIGWLLDFIVYSCLGVFYNNYFLNNILSSLLGATFVFLFSVRVVFQNKHKVPLWMKYAIYIAYQCVLIFLVSKMLMLLDIWILNHIDINIIKRFSHLIAKMAITPVTMLCNFIVMKNVVENI